MIHSSALPAADPMTSPHYRHQIIRWNGTSSEASRYQLQVFELGEHGQPLHRAQWSFATFRGLLTFLSKHFPDSALLSKAGEPSIEFRVAQAVGEL